MPTLTPAQMRVQIGTYEFGKSGRDNTVTPDWLENKVKELLEESRYMVDNYANVIEDTLTYLIAQDLRNYINIGKVLTLLDDEIGAEDDKVWFDYTGKSNSETALGTYIESFFSGILTSGNIPEADRINLITDKLGKRLNFSYELKSQLRNQKSTGTSGIHVGDVTAPKKVNIAESKMVQAVLVLTDEPKYQLNVLLYKLLTKIQHLLIIQYAERNKKSQLNIKSLTFYSVLIEKYIIDTMTEIVRQMGSGVDASATEGLFRITKKVSVPDSKGSEGVYDYGGYSFGIELLSNLFDDEYTVIDAEGKSRTYRQWEKLYKYRRDLYNLYGNTPNTTMRSAFWKMVYELDKLTDRDLIHRNTNL